VVASIEQAINGFVYSLNGVWDRKISLDPTQRVRVTFLQCPGSDVLIELVEPAEEKSPVQAFLQKGGGLHHLCYEVRDCDAALRLMRGRKAMLVKRPNPAVAFGGRRIAWVLTAEKLLLEFLEQAAG
jgi:methylmalonyl-CoA/ethylmalonyl-CoA epimerase